jgi:mono/diheme cytochrome c family protein
MRHIRSARRVRLPVRSASLLFGAAIAFSQLVVAHAASPLPSHFANADDAKLVATGQKVYQQNCGSCHGRRLQGQALWQLQDQFAGRRAPAHDATGHTWQHSDEDLFQKTKFGRFPASPPDKVSYMPAFEKLLSDDDILSAIAFIKFRWPLGMRASQAMLNPGFAGMPANVGQLKWTLPPNCIESITGWQSK